MDSQRARSQASIHDQSTSFGAQEARAHGPGSSSSATAILDVGANQSFANHLAAGACNDTARVVTETVGADGHAWRFSAFGDVALRIGGVPFVASSVLVGDLPIFAKLGLANGPAVIIGADLLASRRIVIDPARHRVYFSTTPAHGPPRAAPARLRLV